MTFLDTTASLRYLILKNIDMCSLSATHAYHLESLVRSANVIKDELLVCGGVDVWERYVNAFKKEYLLYLGMPSSSTPTKYLYRVNLIPLLLAIQDHKDLYVNLFDSVCNVMYKKVLGVLTTVLPKDLWHKRRLVGLLVWLTVASLVIPTFKLSQLTHYVPKTIRYTDTEVNVMQRYMEGNNIPTFWLQYIKEVVLENRLSLVSLSYIFKRSRLHDLTVLIDSLYGRSYECHKPFAYHIFLDLVFSLLSLPYSAKLWKDVVSAFEKIVEEATIV